jgi:hypothetical protein
VLPELLVLAQEQWAGPVQQEPLPPGEAQPLQLLGQAAVRRPPLGLALRQGQPQVPGRAPLPQPEQQLPLVGALPVGERAPPSLLLQELVAP